MFLEPNDLIQLTEKRKNSGKKMLYPNIGMFKPKVKSTEETKTPINKNNKDEYNKNIITI